MRKLRLATRASALALWQANWVASGLRGNGHEVELVKVETQGDRDTRPFREMQGQAFFTKAVQDTLLDGQADLAVHSYKDLPSARHERLVIAAVPERAPSHDVLLINPERHDPDGGPLPLRPGARVGTSAARRRAQLTALRPDLQALDLRGNVETRIGKLRNSDYDAIVLAAAGLSRLQLGLDDLIVVNLATDVFLPAPAQGALALECRHDDPGVIAALAALNDPEAALAVSAERGLMARLDGGCQLALGANARLDAGRITLSAWYEGKQVSASGATPDEAIETVFAAISGGAG